MQSFFVTVQNANLMNCSECVEMYALSFPRNAALTLANTSSSGMRSGLQYMSRAPTPLMISCIRATMMNTGVVHDDY